MNFKTLAITLALSILVLACSGPAESKKKDDILTDDTELVGELGAGKSSCVGEGCVAACDGGDAAACTQLGSQLLEAGKSADAAARFEAGCNGGAIPACTFFGIMRRDGLGGTADVDVAAAALDKGCTGGDALACMTLGNMHQQGELADANLTLASDLFEQACNGGMADGCFNVGINVFNGEGATKDDERAKSLFDKGCDGGSARACTGLATMTAAAGDDAGARRLFEKACKLRDDQATGCFEAGFYAARGKGGDADQEAAGAYLTLACDAGVKKACQAIGR